MDDSRKDSSKNVDAALEGLEFTSTNFEVLGEILVFTLILVVGFVYVWVKGDLEWLKSLGEVRTEPRKLDD